MEPKPPATVIRPRDRARRFDVVVFGATGFAGRLVAEYLAERYGASDLRWAMAGRSPDKLERVRAEIAEQHPAAKDVELVVADSRDRASLERMAAAAEVVCTTVGPYALYGDPLVEACVDNGTDYCDLTGEVQWIRRGIDAHQARAEATGARIVHCCGFDSIPSDLGVFALQEAAIARDGTPVEEVRFFLAGAKGGFSGGTAASLANALKEAEDPAVRKIMGHAYALNPEGERKGPDRGDQMGVAKDPISGRWTGPFVMAAVNTRVVRRSNALLGYRYGADFRYSEVVRFPRGAKGLASATAYTAGFAALLGALAARPTRALVERFALPKPGEGPSRESIERGWFRIVLSGRTGGEEVLTVDVKGQRDPGYGATACMLAESALCLALQGRELSSPGGILTPASAMGQALVDRLNAQDVAFQIRT
jgi:short subunit dehydrogenase-like uncharacterized protein